MRYRITHFAFAALIGSIILFSSSCTGNKGILPPKPSPSLCDQLNVTYSKTIGPMLVTNCATSGCHDADGNAPGDYNNYADIKKRVDNGELKNRVFIDKNAPMPPDKPMSASDLQKLTCWLDKGGPNN